MSKKMVFVIALVVGIGAAFLAVTLGDWITAPREPVEIIQKATLSQEAWEQLEEILNR